MIYTAKITKEIVRCYLSYRNNLDTEVSVPCVNNISDPVLLTENYEIIRTYMILL